jgi:hypothetical protein
MKFGKVSAEELYQLELSLPSDHKSIRELSGKNRNAPRVFVGCAKWGRKEWLGLLYPEGTAEKHGSTSGNILQPEPLFTNTEYFTNNFQLEPSVADFLAQKGFGIISGDMLSTLY